MSKKVRPLKFYDDAKMAAVRDYSSSKASRPADLKPLLPSVRTSYEASGA